MAQHSFRSVEDYEYEMEVQARWRPMVEAAGLWNNKQDAMSTFLLAGAIMNDPQFAKYVCGRLLEIQRGADDIATSTGEAELLEAWPAREKEALRKRVLSFFGKTEVRK